jgi:hypothetical protein
MPQIVGVITQISQSAGSKQRFAAREIAARIALWVVLGLVLGPVIVAIWITSSLLPSASNPRILSHLAERVAGYWMGMRLWQKMNVSGLDLRVRENGTAQTRLIRVIGPLAAGNLATGDLITVRGVIHNGTLFFREGINHTINSLLILE